MTHGILHVLGIQLLAKRSAGEACAVAQVENGFEKQKSGTCKISPHRPVLPPRPRIRAEPKAENYVYASADSAFFHFASTETGLGRECTRGVTPTSTPDLNLDIEF
ncbi:hypothetical protein C8R45DRAFT_1080929 [Mycena sanguinolenta]|nr:hypothetical protein C8R45DRAFT_1083354 [Mycena sanguinolenta]KAJ6461473.1 hypothetical protein C8R45DRAFT_1080929 [Mycena sanguinolenta]